MKFDYEWWVLGVPSSYLHTRPLPASVDGWRWPVSDRKSLSGLDIIACTTYIATTALNTERSVQLRGWLLKWQLLTFSCCIYRTKSHWCARTVIPQFYFLLAETGEKILSFEKFLKMQPDLWVIAYLFVPLLFTSRSIKSFQEVLNFFSFLVYFRL